MTRYQIGAHQSTYLQSNGGDVKAITLAIGIEIAKRNDIVLCRGILACRKRRNVNGNARHAPFTSNARAQRPHDIGASMTAASTDIGRARHFEGGEARFDSPLLYCWRIHAFIRGHRPAAVIGHFISAFLHQLLIAIHSMVDFKVAVM